MLRPVVLALDDSSGRHVRDPDRRLGLIDVLPSRAASAININAQIAWINLDIDLLFNLGRDENSREGSVAPVTGIERRFSDQTMNARLSSQPTVGIFATERNRRALQSRNIPCGSLEYLCLKAP